MVALSSFILSITYFKHITLSFEWVTEIDTADIKLNWSPGEVIQYISTLTTIWVNEIPAES